MPTHLVEEVERRAAQLRPHEDPRSNKGWDGKPVRFPYSILIPPEVHQAFEFWFTILAKETERELPPPMLLSGPPGLGKSTLAKLIACEVGSSFHQAQGPSLVDLGSILGILPDIEKGAVFFIDEIHRLPAAVAEILYQALDEGALSIPIVAGGRTAIVRLRLEPFVLVGATTEESLLPGPLRSRFGIRERLEFYSSEDLERLAARAAQAMKIELTAEAAGVLAKCARGTPQHSQQSTVDSRQQEAGLGVRSRAEFPGGPNKAYRSRSMLHFMLCPD